MVNVLCKTSEIKGSLFTKKLLRIMKLSTFLLFAACLQVSAKGFTQTVTLSVKDASLEKVFAEIKKQTGYTFVYTEDMVQKANTVSLQLKDADIDETLKQCFINQPFTYKIISTVVIINTKDDAEKNWFPPSPIDISGRISDEDGKPLEGANVKVNGSSIGTITNADGIFILKNVDENATIEISYVGYETQFISVKNKSSISLALKRSKNPLDEVQVIAYGTTSQRYSVGNIATVTEKEIEKQPVNNPLLALEGRVPGLFITQNSGLSGSGITVRIQGQNSIQSGNDPLYVIDGVPVFSQLPGTGIDLILGTSGTVPIGSVAGAGNPLSYINPSDIESISVLKDADATAIYGSRAANGAILITTRKGKAGKSKVDLNLQSGYGQLASKIDMMSTQQYLNMRHEAYLNDNITNIPSTAYDLMLWDTTRNTDWQKLLIRNASQYSNFSGSLSGGTTAIQYIIGATYHKETTVFPLPSSFADQKANVHFSLTGTAPNKKLHFQFTGNYMVDNNQLPTTDLTGSAIQLEPDAPSLYNSDGSLNWALNTAGNATFNNPLAVIYSKYTNKTTNLISNLIVGYKIANGLEVSSSFGYTNMQTNDFTPVSLLSLRPQDRPFSTSQALYGNRTINSYIIEPQADYKGSFGKSKIDILVGATFLQNHSLGGSLVGIGYTSDQQLENIAAASSVVVNSQFETNYKYNAIFGRANYQLADKYILDLTLRRDGSSRFGPANLFHDFGALGAGWLFSNEQFLRFMNRVISFGKIRASYGLTGNDQIADYSYLSLYNVVGNVTSNYQGIVGISPTAISNPYLQWETTKKLQIGIDIGLFNNRIFLTSTFQRNRSSNELLPYQLTSVTGFSSVIENFPATVQNLSWEFSLATTNIKNKDFNWVSAFNLTIPRNKLISFPNIASSSYANTLIVGQPLTILRTTHFLGVNPTTGIYQFADGQNPPTIAPTSPKDYTVLINTLPKFYGGFQNTISYKGIQLDFLFQYVKQEGLQIYYNNGGSFPPGYFTDGNSNQPVTVLNRWRKPGDITLIQEVHSTLNPYRSRVRLAKGSDAGFSDASFWRLKNLALSWGIPDKMLRVIHFQSVRLYTQCQNLLTFTNYKGLDPENQSTTSLPPLRVITFGLQIGL